MKRPFAATVWREGKWYVSQCLELDIASQGETEEEALANLREALELHFEETPSHAATESLHDRGRGWRGLSRYPSGRSSVDLKPLGSSRSARSAATSNSFARR